MVGARMLFEDEVMTVKQHEVLYFNGCFYSSSLNYYGDYNRHRVLSRLTTAESQPSIGFKSKTKLTALRQFEYRCKLNISMNSKFHMPCNIWIGMRVRTYFASMTCALTLIGQSRDPLARTKTDSLIHPWIYRKSIKLGDNGTVSSSCAFRKCLKIYTDVLHDMVVDYRVWLCPISNAAN